MTLLLIVAILLFMLIVSILSACKTNKPLGVFYFVSCGFLLYNCEWMALPFIVIVSFYIMPFFKPTYDIGPNRYPTAPIVSREHSV